MMPLQLSNRKGSQLCGSPLRISLLPASYRRLHLGGLLFPKLQQSGQRQESATCQSTTQPSGATRRVHLPSLPLCPSPLLEPDPELHYLWGRTSKQTFERKRKRKKKEEEEEGWGGGVCII